MTCVGVTQDLLVLANDYLGFASDDQPKRRDRFGPQRAQPLLVPLAVEPNLPSPVQAEFARMDGQCLTHSGAGVVEKKREGSIAPGVGCGGIHRGDDGARFFGFEVRDRALCSPF